MPVLRIQDEIHRPKSGIQNWLLSGPTLHGTPPGETLLHIVMQVRTDRAWTYYLVLSPNNKRSFKAMTQIYLAPKRIYQYAINRYDQLCRPFGIVFFEPALAVCISTCFFSDTWSISWKSEQVQELCNIFRTLEPLLSFWKQIVNFSSCWNRCWLYFMHQYATRSSIM